MSELKFARTLTSDKFYKEIDGLVKKHKLNYMDAVVYFCEQNQIEIETAASLIRSNHRIKSLIQDEGEILRLLPKTAKLPI